MRSFDMSIPIGRWVDTEQEARQWIQHFLVSSKVNNGLGLDTETTGLDRLRDRVVVWSIADAANRICLPVELLPLFKEPILENPNINFDLTNAKFDAHMLANNGIDISKAGEWRCTIVQSFLINENNQGRHGLKECVTDYFGRTTPTFAETFGKIPNKKIDKKTGANLNQTAGDLIKKAFQDAEKKLLAADYSSLDAYNSHVLRIHLDGLLKSIRIDAEYGGMSDLRSYFYAIEAPFTKVLWNLERRGITVDKGYLEELRGPMEKEMAKVESEFNQACAQPINLKSTEHLRWFFFEFLKKDIVKMTKGGASGNKKPSTDYDVLQEWAGNGDPWALKLLDYRSVSKIHGTYIVGLQKWIDQNYRIHTTLNQTGAVTMRLSSSEPNLQNIPRPSEDRFKVRNAFTHGERMTLIVADYAQLEMRIMAHFSGDEKMIDAIKNGVDLHCMTVSEMYGIPYDDVMTAKNEDSLVKKGIRKEPLTPREEELLFYRQAAKATGFGILYGIGGEHLAASLTQELKKLVTKEEGFSLIKKWFGVFPGVKAYVEMKKADIWKEGYVQTLVGRFRRFGDLQGMKKGDSARCERQGVNAIIQGTASDIAKKTMLLAEHDPVLKQLGARMLLQIHDELMFEVPNDPEVVKTAKDRVKELMEHPFNKELRVPIPAEVGNGETWATAK